MRRVRPQRRVLSFCPDRDFAVSVKICTDYVDLAVYSLLLARNVPRIVPSRASAPGLQRVMSLKSFL
jgi:hypothetical protein